MRDLRRPCPAGVALRRGGKTKRADERGHGGVGALEWVALAAILGLAGGLRALGMDNGVTSDELANVMPWSARQILTDPEAGVNPPLLRLLANVPFDDAGAVSAGRAFAWCASTGAVGVAWALGRRAGGPVAGALAATLAALHPFAVVYGAIYRSYAPFALTAAVYALALTWVSAPGGRWRSPAGVALVAAAVLLPWWHYIGVLVLVGVGLGLLLWPGQRRWLLASVAAAVAISPMIPFVLSAPQRREAPRGTPIEAMGEVVAMTLQPPRAVAKPAVELAAALGLDPPFVPGLLGDLFGLVIVGHVLAWRWLDPARRVLTAGAVSVAAAAWALAHVQYVRDPVSVMMLVFLGPLLAAAPALVRAPPGARPWWRMGASGVRGLAWAALAWLLFADMPERLAFQLERARDPDAVRDVGRLLGAGALPTRPGERLWVHPSYVTPTLWFVASGTHFGRAPVPAGCGDDRPCFGWPSVPRGDGEEDGSVGDGAQVVVGLPEGARAADVVGVVVSTDVYRGAAFGAGCVALEAVGKAGLWRCSGGEAPGAQGGADGAEGSP